MITIDFKTEVHYFNPVERTCMIILYGIALENEIEVGKFFLEKKLIQEAEYDQYANQVNQSIDPGFLSQWKDGILQPLMNGLEKFETDSNINLNNNLI